MRRFPLVILVLTLCGSALLGACAAPAPSGWEATWSDERTYVDEWGTTFRVGEA